MNLGFSMTASPIQAASPALAAQGLAMRPDQLLAKTAALAGQLGATSSFFSQLNVNRYFVSRMAILAPSKSDDETFDKKQAKEIIRKLKAEKTEATNDQRPDK